MALTITGANSVFALSIAGLFAAPQILQGFAADDAFSADNISPAEVVMGVDGNMSAGFVHVQKKVNMMLMPDSPSSPLFEQWYSTMEQQNEILFASGTVLLPATGTAYTLQKGVLTDYVPFPNVKKLLAARTFSITWQRILPATV